MSILACAVHAEPFPLKGPVPYSFDSLGDSHYSISVGDYSLHYFKLEHSTNLMIPWRPLDMALGSPAPTLGFTILPGVPRDFYRMKAIDIWSPGDADGDGMDDLWELRNELNPMVAADAQQTSALNSSMTNLQYYQARFAISGFREIYSSEVSLHNHPEVYSGEISLYKFAPTTNNLLEAISPEVSVYSLPIVNGVLKEAFSTEVSVYKANPVELSSAEAISSEVSVYKATAISLSAAEAISTEVSVYKGSTVALNAAEAISSEVSVSKVNPVQLFLLEAITVETSIYKSTGVELPPSSISGEVSVLRNGP